MDAHFTGMTLPELIDRLGDYDDRRTPAGWTLEEAIARSSLERCVLERLTSPLTASDAPELPCSTPVRMRSGAIAATGRIRGLLPGGLLLSSSWPWPRGNTVELQLEANGAELGPRIRVTVLREHDDMFVVALPSPVDEATERRVRRFILELLRTRTES